MKKQSIFITGGMGFIGAPTAQRLYNNGYRVVIFDCVFSRSMSGIGESTIPQIEGDIRHLDELTSAMQNYHPDVVLHLAAQTSVIESARQKKLYEEVNGTGTRNVLRAMKTSGCTNIIFASSASVYGKTNDRLPENSPLHPDHVYARTKAEGERVIRSTPDMCSVILRYFNVVGFTKDGRFGEAIENNPKLVPSILRVGLEMEKSVILYGKKYPTPDKTAIRDYVSLEDVVRANVMAVQHLLSFPKLKKPLRQLVDREWNCICNIGSGIPTSNLEAVRSVEKQIKRPIPVIFTLPRKEACISVANRAQAKHILGWEPRFSTMSEIINGYVAFQKKLHP